MEKIIEGRFVDAFNDFEGGIMIRNGRIVAVSKQRDTSEEPIRGKIIFPGFIDIHVHAREDTSGKHNYKEDFYTASLAAINGGVVAIGEMPNNPEPPVDYESYKAKSELTRKSLIDVLLYMAVRKDTKPLSRVELWRLGMREIPYKIFAGPSVGDKSIFFEDYPSLLEVNIRYRGKHRSYHCEDAGILIENKDKPTHEEKRPAEAEDKCGKWVIDKSHKKDKINICHLSTAYLKDYIWTQKKLKRKITCEAAPHHIFFDERVASKWLQMNPPLRNELDRLALRYGLLEGGVIDFLASDHAPHTIEEKEKGMSGVPHLDTYGAFVTWLVKELNVPLSKIAELTSYNAGRFWHNFRCEKYGRLKRGYEASFTVLDFDTPISITRDMLQTKCGWSPFEGITFPGSVAETYIRGEPMKSMMLEGRL